MINSHKRKFNFLLMGSGSRQLDQLCSHPIMAFESVKIWNAPMEHRSYCCNIMNAHHLKEFGQFCTYPCSIFLMASMFADLMSCISPHICNSIALPFSNNLHFCICLSLNLQIFFTSLG